LADSKFLSFFSQFTHLYTDRAEKVLAQVLREESFAHSKQPVSYPPTNANAPSYSTLNVPPSYPIITVDVNLQVPRAHHSSLPQESSAPNTKGRNTLITEGFRFEGVYQGTVSVTSNMELDQDSGYSETCSAPQFNNYCNGTYVQQTFYSSNEYGMDLPEMQAAAQPYVNLEYREIDSETEELAYGMVEVPRPPIVYNPNMDQHSEARYDLIPFRKLLPKPRPQPQQQQQHYPKIPTLPWDPEVFKNEVEDAQHTNTKNIYFTKPLDKKRKTTKLWYNCEYTLKDPELLYYGLSRETTLPSDEDALKLNDPWETQKFKYCCKEQLKYCMLIWVGLNKARKGNKELPGRSQKGKHHSGYYKIRFLLYKENPQIVSYVYTKLFKVSSTKDRNNDRNDEK